MMEEANSEGSISEGSESRSESETSSMRACWDILWLEFLFEGPRFDVQVLVERRPGGGNCGV